MKRLWKHIYQSSFVIFLITAFWFYLQFKLHYLWLVKVWSYMMVVSSKIKPIFFFFLHPWCRWSKSNNIPDFGGYSKYKSTFFWHPINKDTMISSICQTDFARMPCDMWINHVSRGMRWYSTDFSDFAYPWKAFCTLWSNIWGADKNPSVASKQLQGLTLSKRGFYFPTVSTSCVYFIEPFSSHRGAQQPYGAENVFWGSLTQSVHAWNI